jgi:hypothetical protein
MEGLEINNADLASGMGFPPLLGTSGIYHFFIADVNPLIGAFGERTLDLFKRQKCYKKLLLLPKAQRSSSAAVLKSG